MVVVCQGIKAVVLVFISVIIYFIAILFFRFSFTLCYRYSLFSDSPISFDFYLVLARLLSSMNISFPLFFSILIFILTTFYLSKALKLLDEF